MVIKQQLQVTAAVEMDAYGDQVAAASDCSCRDGSLW